MPLLEDNRVNLDDALVIIFSCSTDKTGETCGVCMGVPNDLTGVLTSHGSVETAERPCQNISLYHE